MDANKTVGATFNPAPFTVTVQAGGNGNGTVTTQAGLIPAINCTLRGGVPSGACGGTYPAGTRVELRTSADANAGNAFSGWSGACSGTTEPCVVPSLAGGIPTVVANFDYNVCRERGIHTFNTSSTGSIGIGDCVSPRIGQSGSGWRRDAWNVSFSQTQMMVASLSSNSAQLRVSFVPNPPGSNSLNGFEWFVAGGTFVSFRVLAPVGTTTLMPANASESAFGNYTLTTAPTTVDGCNPVIRTSFGVNTSAFALARPGTVADCTYTASTGTVGPADRFTMYVPSGRTLTVTVTSSAFQPLIELRDGFVDNLGTGSLFQSTKGAPAGSTATLSSSGGGWIQIWVSSRDGKTGDYTFTIDP
jgi:hypothetical protein